jgi:cytochrome c553
MRRRAGLSAGRFLTSTARENMVRSSRLPALRSRTRRIIWTALIALLPAAAVHAGGSADAGKTRAAACAACHGADGNSLNPEWPSLAGQHEAYLVSALRSFRNCNQKECPRQNVLMSGQALALTEEDIADLAAYYATQIRKPMAADPNLVTTGERLYRGGNMDAAVGACIACHGPDGRGNAPAAYPVVAGQHAAYTSAQLKAYRAGQRSSDPNQMMRNVAARLTDAEIEAVASYIQGLH